MNSIINLGPRPSQLHPTSVVDSPLLETPPGKKHILVRHLTSPNYLLTSNNLIMLRMMKTPLSVAPHVYCWFDHHFLDCWFKKTAFRSQHTYGNCNTSKQILKCHHPPISLGSISIFQRHFERQTRGHVARCWALPHSATAPWRMIMGGLWNKSGWWFIYG